MSEHKTRIDGFASLKELAVAVCDLRYDALYEFLSAMEIKLRNDSDADRDCGRTKLAAMLETASRNVDQVAVFIKEAPQISERATRILPSD